GEAAGARVEADVRRIIEAVRRRGDRALLAFTRRFDGVSLRRGELRVPDGALARAYRKQPPSVRRDLALAARRIRAFHARQRERSWSFRDATGARLGQRIEPLARVGVYIPGGRAVYPSTVLMTVVTARVAGVRVVIVADRSADPELVAADMLAQAEHDPLAAAVCLTTDRRLAARVAAALAAQLATLPRRAIAERALAAFGAIVVTRSVAEAVEIANRLAPEHLELAVRDPGPVAAGVRHAG